MKNVLFNLVPIIVKIVEIIQTKIVFLFDFLVRN